jgi:hypothetical protein
MCPKIVAISIAPVRPKARARAMKILFIDRPKIADRIDASD